MIWMALIAGIIFLAVWSSCVVSSRYSRYEDREHSQSGSESGIRKEKADILKEQEE